MLQRPCCSGGGGGGDKKTRLGAKQTPLAGCAGNIVEPNTTHIINQSAKKNTKEKKVRMVQFCGAEVLRFFFFDGVPVSSTDWSAERRGGPHDSDVPSRVNLNHLCCCPMEQQPRYLLSVGSDSD